jgi:hypothetical protein
MKISSEISYRSKDWISHRKDRIVSQSSTDCTFSLTSFRLLFFQLLPSDFFYFVSFSFRFRFKTHFFSQDCFQSSPALSVLQDLGSILVLVACGGVLVLGSILVLVFCGGVLVLGSIRMFCGEILVLGLRWLLVRTVLSCVRQAT